MTKIYKRALLRRKKSLVTNFLEQKLYGIDCWICSVIFKFYSTTLITTPNTIIIELQHRKQNYRVFECLKLSFFAMKKFLLDFDDVRILRNIANLWDE